MGESHSRRRLSCEGRCEAYRKILLARAPPRTVIIVSVGRVRDNTNEPCRREHSKKENLALLVRFLGSDRRLTESAGKVPQVFGYRSRSRKSPVVNTAECSESSAGWRKARRQICDYSSQKHAGIEAATIPLSNLVRLERKQLAAAMRMNLASLEWSDTAMQSSACLQPAGLSASQHPQQRIPKAESIPREGWK